MGRRAAFEDVVVLVSLEYLGRLMGDAVGQVRCSESDVMMLERPLQVSPSIRSFLGYCVAIGIIFITLIFPAQGIQTGIVCLWTAVGGG